MAIDSSVISLAKFNPLATNKLSSRADVVDALHDLFNPLLPFFSNDKARVQLDASASTHDRAACDLEGWARPLFGIVPLVVGGDSFRHWEIYVEGLKNGTDPKHPEYWGEVKNHDQRHVEATAIGLTLLLTREYIWDPLDEVSRRNVAEWLLSSRNGDHAGNNHMWFRVIVDLGLKHVGVDVDGSMTEDYLVRLEKLYIGDGWYRDEDDARDYRRIDYYNPWAMHLYGLLYAKYCPDDKARGDRLRDRARKFAQHFQHWFADDGSSVPFGRSLVYRFCAVAFWGALALADEEALPYGVMKGLYLRNLRWWSTQPIASHGLLTLGYSYPNQLISERYCSTGSPFWAFKAFFALALPSSHPFWAEEEIPISRANKLSSPLVGMVLLHQPKHTVLLMSGPETSQVMRGVPEKYKKFAYSSRYGFSVESDPVGFKTGAFDNMISLSDDGVHYRVREHCVKAAIADDKLYSVWYPWADCKVESWIIPEGVWHIRIHRIWSPRRLLTIEGGFAAPRTDFNQDTQEVSGGSANILSRIGDFSGIADASTPKRTARVMAPHGNTNVMFGRTLVPQLEGVVVAAVPTIFACAILAGPDGGQMRVFWDSGFPRVPAVEECEELFAQQGSVVEICKSSIPK